MNTTSNRVFDPEAKRAIINRLRRAEGQLAAVTNAVEGDAGCRTVVQRLSAVSKALGRPERRTRISPDNRRLSSDGVSIAQSSPRAFPRVPGT